MQKCLTHGLTPHTIDNPLDPTDRLCPVCHESTQEDNDRDPTPEDFENIIPPNHPYNSVSIYFHYGDEDAIPISAQVNADGTFTATIQLEVKTHKDVRLITTALAQLQAMARTYVA